VTWQGSALQALSELHVASAVLPRDLLPACPAINNLDL